MTDSTLAYNDGYNHGFLDGSKVAAGLATTPQEPRPADRATVRDLITADEIERLKSTVTSKEPVGYEWSDEAEPSREAVPTPSADPMNAARAIIVDRLQRDVPDDSRRWEIGTAIATVLDMAGLLAGQAETPTLSAAPWGADEIAALEWAVLAARSRGAFYRSDVLRSIAARLSSPQTPETADE